MSIKLDYIIPTYQLDDYRRRNLQSHKQWIESQEHVDVTLHVMEQDYGVFNKQWLCNKGVKESESDHIIIADADIIDESKTYLADFMSWVSDNSIRWAFGWSRVIYDGRKPGTVERYDWPEPGINEGCVVYFEKSLWEKMGGANEWIKALRGPDNDLAMRARYITGYHIAYPYKLRHQWHPKSKMKGGKYRKRNVEILKYTRRHPAEVINLLQQQNRGDSNGSYAEVQSFFEARTK